uniref:Condensin complex subunit 1 n=1 Tax=Steinernema glaseri TaxID=37863 RepID=A0A1I7ZVM1_9BILA
MGRQKGAEAQIAEVLQEVGPQAFWRHIQEAVPFASNWPEYCRCIGRALMDAWMKAKDDEGAEYRRNLESFVITELFYNAVMLVGPLQARFMAILSGLLHDKKVEMDSMIFRCSEPVLWRYLEAANDNVRAGAASILLKFYPILDDDPETNTEFLIKQNLALRTLLSDMSVPIRLNATRSIFGLLKNYWKIMSEEDRAAIFTILVKRNAFDCDLVKRNAFDCDVSIREAVYEGLVKLLPEAQCISIVKSVLEAIVPKGIDDKHYKVRVAAFKLLSELKLHRMIKPFDIVTGAHILTRLDLEHNTEVKKYAVRLMAPQFLPKKKKLQERVRRLLILLQHSPRAALIFHRYLTCVESVKLEDAVAHIKMIGTVVYITLKRKLTQIDPEEGVEMSDSLLNDTVATLSGAPDLPPIDQEEGRAEAFQQMKTLVDCAIILLITIQQKLRENPQQFTVLNKFLVFFFKKMFVSYRNTVLFESIMVLGSYLSEEDIGDISTRIVKTLDDVNDDQGDVRPYLAAALSWRTEELFDVIEASFNALDSMDAPQRSRGKGPKPIKFTRAIEYLEYILANPAVDDRLFKNYATTFERFFNKLKKIKNFISARLENGGEDPENPLDCEDADLMKALNVKHVIGVKLASFLSDETDPNYAGIVPNVVTEVAKDVLWFSEIPPPEDDSSLYETLSKEIFHLISVHLQSHEANIEFVSACFNLIKAFTEGCAPPEYIVSVLKTAKHLFRAVLSMEDTTESVVRDMLPMLDDLMEWIREYCAEFDDRTARDVSSAYVSLSSALFSNTYVAKMKSTYRHVDTSFITLLDGFINRISSMREVLDPNDHTFELSAFCDFYLKRILPRMSAPFYTLFLEAFFERISTTIVPEGTTEWKVLIRIAAAVQLSHFLKVPRSKEKDFRKAKGFFRSTAAKLHCEDGDARHMREQLLSIIRF